MQVKKGTGAVVDETGAVHESPVKLGACTSSAVAHAIAQLRRALREAYGNDFSFAVTGRGHVIASSSMRDGQVAACVDGAEVNNPLLRVRLERIEMGGGVGEVEEIEFRAAAVLRHSGINGVWGNLPFDWHEDALAEDYALWFAKRRHGDHREYRVEVIEDGLAAAPAQAA